MALHTDLLAQARHLASKEPGRPKQASLRRAVSAAYYALFHLLVAEASHFLVSGTTPHRAGLRDQVSRAFEHSQMKAASQAFAGNGKNAWLALAGNISPALTSLATVFVEVQQERHDADYNLARAFTRHEVLAIVARVTSAMHSWNALRGSAAAEAYLMSLVLRSRT